jgi:uncharacterized protein (DUF983 family)
MENQNTKCKKCNSGQTYIKLSTNERVCRYCGHIEDLKKEAKN